MPTIGQYAKSIYAPETNKERVASGVFNTILAALPFALWAIKTGVQFNASTLSNFLKSPYASFGLAGVVATVGYGRNLALQQPKPGDVTIQEHEAQVEQAKRDAIVGYVKQEGVNQQLAQKEADARVGYVKQEDVNQQLEQKEKDARVDYVHKDQVSQILENKENYVSKQTVWDVINDKQDNTSKIVTLQRILTPQ